METAQKSTLPQDAIAWPLMLWLPNFWLGSATTARPSASEAAIAAPSRPEPAVPAAGDIARASEQAMQAWSSCGTELLSLACRRAHAWQSLPARLGRARTPQDLMNANVQFWSLAVEQHGEAARRLAAAWSGGMFGMGDAGTGLYGAKTTVRDRMSLSDGSEAGQDGRAGHSGQSAQQSRQQNDRRSAA